MKIEKAHYPESLPYSSKVKWKYKDMFSDYPATKLCMSFLHKNYSMDIHSHEFYEINIIISGTGIHYYKGNKIIVKRGDIFIIPPNVEHGYYNLDNLCVYHAIYQDQFFVKYSQDLELVSSYRILFGMNAYNLETTPFYLNQSNEKEFKKIENTITNLDISINNGDAFAVQTTEFVKSYIYGLILIINLCDLYSTNAVDNRNEISQNNEPTYKAIEYIHNNYMKKINVDILCDIASMSRTPFFKKFKQITGSTPNEFIVNYRLKIANKLIIETDYSMDTISEMAGFYDASHFTKAYTKFYGNTPLSNRKR